MKNAMRRVFLLVAAIASVCAAVLVGAGPAVASGFVNHFATDKKWESESYYCLQNVTRAAVGCIIMNGDYVAVGDLAKDSRRVGVYWETNRGYKGLCQNTHGVDAMADVYGPPNGRHACNENWGEGVEIRFKVGICNGSKWDCNQLKYWYYWSGVSRWYHNVNS